MSKLIGSIFNVHLHLIYNKLYVSAEYTSTECTIINIRTYIDPESYYMHIPGPVHIAGPSTPRILSITRILDTYKYIHSTSYTHTQHNGD